MINFKFYECNLTKKDHLKMKNVIVEMKTQWIGLKSTVLTDTVEEKSSKRKDVFGEIIQNATKRKRR